MRMPQKPPAWLDIIDQIGGVRAILEENVHTGDDGLRYLHWDEIRRRRPPADWDHDRWWAHTKLERHAQRRDIPLLDKTGTPFAMVMTDGILESLSGIDQKTAGNIMADDRFINRETSDRYIISSLIEEATTSSLLEGAATTREEAREMIRQGRDARSRGEQMVLNNFRAMQHIRTVKDQELTPAIVLDLHRRMTEHTWEGESAGGRYRTMDEKVTVRTQDDEILHVPPPASELPDRVQSMCDFANGETPGRYIHPVVRAIILHFWLAYDHPFKDGNGRTARALFYWLLLREKYWLFEFLPISSRILKAPSKYSRAFLFTESDENDLTYFIVFNLAVIESAIAALDEYLHRKGQEVQQLERRIRNSADYNHRQIALLGHALRHPNHEYTIDSHRRSHGVTRQTARNDLTFLVEAGLLLEYRRTRRLYFRPTPGLPEKLGPEPV